MNAAEPATGRPVTSIDKGHFGCDSHFMGSTAEHQVQPEVSGRYIAVDEQGHALRATWRPAHGFVNVSLWRDDRCVETFHLTPTDASALVGFLVGAFAASVPSPSNPPLKVVSSSPSPPTSAVSLRKHWQDASDRLRQRMAAELDRLSRSLRR